METKITVSIAWGFRILATLTTIVEYALSIVAVIDQKPTLDELDDLKLKLFWIASCLSTIS